MCLAAGRDVNEYSESFAEAETTLRVDPVYATWENWPVSEISHHGGMCCEIAREWLISTDASERAGQSEKIGPRWIRSRFKWGASAFPIHWCEVVAKKTLDCGALAAIAHEVLLARGVNCKRVQMIQRFSEASISQWTSSWANGNGSLAWTKKDLIYHEACAVIDQDQRARIWDPSAGWWVDSCLNKGYGAVLAVRITVPSADESTLLHLDGRVVSPNRWLRFF